MLLDAIVYSTFESTYDIHSGSFREFQNANIFVCTFTNARVSACLKSARVSSLFSKFMKTRKRGRNLRSCNTDHGRFVAL